MDVASRKDIAPRMKSRVRLVQGGLNSGRDFLIACAASKRSLRYAVCSRTVFAAASTSLTRKAARISSCCRAITLRSRTR